jgi:beta-mannosidase
MTWELQSAAKANHNIIRVWGGGLYERNHFYETCDKLGLLVWQDFMFACAMYPTNEVFISSVQAEVTHQIRRLNHHPSLALWCGNNEIEQLLGSISHHKTESQNISTTLMDEMFVKTIMPIVNSIDPGRSYWPSSPSNGVRQYGFFNDQTRGDVHYWNVWHGGRPFSDYLTVKPRFSSEFGFQSFASPETMATVTLPEDQNIASEVFEHHQRSGQGNLTILNHIARQFRIPTGYENMLYVSQALQALSIKVACEHWRRIKPHNMGTIIWQLNDIWPVASWSSLEYDGRWKMLHYYEKNFYAPLLISAIENEDNIEIWATSDINSSQNATFNLDLLDMDGTSHFSDSKYIYLQALESKCIATYKQTDLCKTKDSRKQLFLSFSLTNAQFSSSNQHFFCPFKHLKLKQPTINNELTEQNGKLVLTLESDTLAPFTWVRHGNIHGTWSDNGMHILPGQSVKLVFTPRYESPTLEEMNNILIIHNLHDAG